MLSYQHIYHAGCFADVVKHFTLTCILNYLKIKDKPLFYLETHAGRGVYDLLDPKANKTQEHQAGIDLLWQQRKQAPAVFSSYLDTLKTLNPEGILRYYPGSPYLAIHSLRAQDRLLCCELHPTEFEYLTNTSTLKKRVIFSQEDGMQVLNAKLPPLEKRGLIFIDPSFEIKKEYKQIPKAIENVYKRFSTATYCLWYPLIDPYYTEQLLRNCKNIPSQDKLRVEFSLTPKMQTGMQGCGLIVINPPYTLTKELEIGLDYLCTLFNPGISSYAIEVI